MLAIRRPGVEQLLEDSDPIEARDGEVDSLGAWYCGGRGPSDEEGTWNEVALVVVVANEDDGVVVALVGADVASGEVVVLVDERDLEAFLRGELLGWGCDVDGFEPD